MVAALSLDISASFIGGFPLLQQALSTLRVAETLYLWSESLTKVVISVYWVRILVVIILLPTVSTEMTSSILSVHWPFIWRWDLLPNVDRVGTLNFYRHGPSVLASPDRFCNFSHGCREGILLTIFVMDATFSTIVVRIQQCRQCSSVVLPGILLMLVN